VHQDVPETDRRSQAFGEIRGYHALLGEQPDSGAVVIGCIRTVFGENVQRDVDRGLDRDLEVTLGRGLKALVREKRVRRLSRDLAQRADPPVV